MYSGKVEDTNFPYVTRMLIVLSALRNNYLLALYMKPKPIATETWKITSTEAIVLPYHGDKPRSPFIARILSVVIDIFPSQT